MGQSPEVVEGTVQIIYCILPGSLIFTQFEALRRHLQAMGVFYLPVFVLIFSLTTTVLFAHILVNIMDLGVVGIGIAYSSKYFKTTGLRAFVYLAPVLEVL